MRYFDTSFLVPLILPEATSEPITEFFEGVSGEVLTVSHWTRLSSHRCLPERFAWAIWTP